MGGTSTDIALVRDGAPTLAEGRAVGQARIALPALDIVTLGAGGGSIAQQDRSGLLAVGPESAGAEPGPACYGLGGTRATVTDANLVLGYLDPARFLGGRRRLDGAAAAAAIGRLATRAGAEPGSDGGGRAPPGQRPHGRRGAHRHGPPRGGSPPLRPAGVRRRRRAARHRGGRRARHRPGGGAARRRGAVGLGHAEHRPAHRTGPQPGTDQGHRPRRAARRLRGDGTGRPRPPRPVRRRGDRPPRRRHALRRAGVRNLRAARRHGLGRARICRHGWRRRSTTGTPPSTPTPCRTRTR